MVHPVRVFPFMQETVKRPERQYAMTVMACVRAGKNRPTGKQADDGRR